MIQQIGASLAFSGDTAIAIVNLQLGVGKEVAAHRSPDAEVVDGDVSAFDGGTITHIDNLVAFSATVKHQ